MVDLLPKGLLDPPGEAKQKAVKPGTNHLCLYETISSIFINISCTIRLPCFLLFHLEKDHENFPKIIPPDYCDLFISLQPPHPTSSKPPP